MGVDMADEIRPHESNAKGHWERWEIVAFHDRVLGLFNRGYSSPFHDFPLPAAWWADPRVHLIKSEIVAFLKTRMGEAVFGFKDPRTVRLMPLWHRIFGELKLAPRIVLCLRNPAQVARSLKVRDGVDTDIAEYRWLVHMTDFFRYSSHFEVCTIEYEKWFSDPLVNFERLRTFLEMDWQQSEADLDLVLSGIIDPTLKHDSSDYEDAGHPLVRSLYRIAKDGDAGRADRSRIGIVSQFVSFQRLQEPFQRAFERAAEIAAETPRLEQEIAALRSAVAERDLAIEAANLRVSAAEQEVQSRLAEHEAALQVALQRADELAALLQSAEAERTAAVEETQVRLAERDAALKTAEQRADEFAALVKSFEAERTAALAEAEAEKARSADFAAELARLHAQLEATRTLLTEAEGSRQQKEKAANELQKEIASLRTALTEAGRSQQRHESVTAELRAEIASLRSTAARAEEQQRGSETANASLRSEIASLKNELAAARDVGKAAIDALRFEAARPAPAVLQKPGWRGSVLRRFGFRPKDPLLMAGQ
jgi:hypothetical protein